MTSTVKGQGYSDLEPERGGGGGINVLQKVVRMKFYCMVKCVWVKAYRIQKK